MEFNSQISVGDIGALLGGLGACVGALATVFILRQANRFRDDYKYTYAFNHATDKYFELVEKLTKLHERLFVIRLMSFEEYIKKKNRNPYLTKDPNDLDRFGQGYTSYKEVCDLKKDLNVLMKTSDYFMPRKLYDQLDMIYSDVREAIHLALNANSQTNFDKKFQALNNLHSEIQTIRLFENPETGAIEFIKLKELFLELNDLKHKTSCQSNPSTRLRFAASREASLRDDE